MKEKSETPKPTHAKKQRTDKESKTTETAPAQTPETAIEETPPPVRSTIETPQTPEPREPFTAPILLESLQRQIDALNIQFQEVLTRKRRPPVSSEGVQVKDKITGQTFRCKNNAYLTLLKAGDPDQ
jgi:hypothetical protein